MKIFISGPMTGCKNYNRPAFFDAEDDLKAQGHTVWNPAHNPDGFEHEEYMHVCLPMIDICDAVYLLNGWGSSQGARQERNYAIRSGKKLIYQEEET